MTTNITTIVDSALRERRLLQHPFYRRWEEGGLTHSELRDYADQYRHFEASLPGTLSDIESLLPAGPMRDAVAANLADEVATPTHLELFEQFADHYGASGASASLAMAELIDAYRTCVTRSSTAALAGLLAYEVQGGEIANTKSAGLLEHYGATRASVEFWRVHGDVEDDHAQWLIDAMEIDDTYEANFGARLVADAWWSFLDEREAQAA